MDYKGIELKAVTNSSSTNDLTNLRILLPICPSRYQTIPLQVLIQEDP